MKKIKNTEPTASGAELNRHSRGKAKTVAKAGVSLVLAGCLIGSLGLNIYQADRSAVQSKKVNRFIDNQLERQAKEEEQENTYQEDGYVIGGQYEIRSTSHISDAYISGDTAKLSKEDKDTLAMASKVLDGLIKKDMGNYEKELAVYRWMYKNIGQGSGAVVTLPGTGGDTFTPNGVLSGKNAVCVGYATTFRLFMNMLGMDCHVVHNDYHSWDMVQLDDGEWYQVDIYSDVSGRSLYRNFNMTDEAARSGHEWDDSALPAAQGVRYSYAVQNNRELADIYAVPAHIKKAIDKKRSSAFYSFRKKLSREELGIADLLVNQMNSVLMTMPGFENYNISGSWYQDEKENYILGLFIVNYTDMNNTQTFDVNSPEGQKMTDAVSEAFGAQPQTDMPDGNAKPYPETKEQKTDEASAAAVIGGTDKQ